MFPLSSLLLSSSPSAIVPLSCRVSRSGPSSHLPLFKVSPLLSSLFRWSLSTTSRHLFRGLRLILLPSTPNSIAILAGSPASFLSMCPNHLSRASLIFSAISTMPHFSRISTSLINLKENGGVFLILDIRCYFSC